MNRALPGQSVFLCGFKTEVEVGSALYTVSDSAEARHIVKMREQRSAAHTAAQKANFVSKKVTRLTRMDKRALYSGDTSILVALL